MVTITVDELKNSFPEPGGIFVLPANLYVPELARMIGTSGTVTLTNCTVDSNNLKISGLAADVRAELTFYADASGRNVDRLAATVPTTWTMTGLGAALGIDLSGLPEAFQISVTSLGVHYNFTSGPVVILAQTSRMRFAAAGLTPNTSLVVLAGLTDSEVLLERLPFIGDLALELPNVGIKGVEAIVAPSAGVTQTQATSLNSAIADVTAATVGWWPSAPSQGLGEGIWLGADLRLPDSEDVWVVKLSADVAWTDIPGLDIGWLKIPTLGLSWTSGTGGTWGWLSIRFDGRLSFGGVEFNLIDFGFDFDFSGPGDWSLLPRLSEISFNLLSWNPTFTVPSNVLDLPGFPGLPSPGVLTGWLASDFTLNRIFSLLGLKIDLPDSLNLEVLPSLGLRLDLKLGNIELIGASALLRFVWGSVPSLESWTLQETSMRWGQFALMGISFEGILAKLSDLPFIGSLLQGFDFQLEGISFAFLDGLGISGFKLPEVNIDRISAWLSGLNPGTWWPSWTETSGGGSSGGWSLPGFSLGIDWRLPDLSSVDWAIPWPPVNRPRPDLTWIELPHGYTLGPLTIKGLGLTWPSPDEIDWPSIDWPSTGNWVLRLEIDVNFDLGGGFSFVLPRLGFDFDLEKLSFLPRLPEIAFTLPGGFTIDLKVPKPGSLPYPKSITAYWTSEEGVTAADICDFLGLDAVGEAIPAILLPTLRFVSLHLDFESWFLVIAGTVSIGEIANNSWAIATQAANSAMRHTLVAVNLALTKLKASDLPWLEGFTDPKLDILLGDIHLVYAQQRWTDPQVAALNAYLISIAAVAGGGVSLPKLLPGEMPPGFSAWGRVSLPGVDVLVCYPERKDQPLAIAGSPDSGADVSGYVIGPMRFQHMRLGLGYGTIYLAIDATMDFGPIELTLIGLGIGIKNDWTPKVILEGAAFVLDSKGPPKADMAGALANIDLGSEYAFAMAGVGRVEIQNLVSIQMAGSFAQNKAGWVSVFGYAELVSPKNKINGLFSLGPVTFVGISLGFGANSHVRTPSVDDIGTFPLVQRLGARPSTPGGDVEELTPAQALNELVGPGGWVTPAMGQYWIAGGAQFTVYQFISTRALVLVEWGLAGWKAMLAGRTTMPLPPIRGGGDESEARAPGVVPRASSVVPSAAGLVPTASGAAPRGDLQITLGQLIVDFVIAYESSISRFSMDVVVAKGSYIIDPEAALTGGVSLYVWGESLPSLAISPGFVLTVGGYHPQFKPPGYYPRPPRLGIQWKRGPVTLTGQCYAAISDGAFMVGFNLAAVAEFGWGINLRAWLTAHVDALVQWKPFYADFAIGLSIGVSASIKIWFVRINISIEVGVDLQLWLPPIGGRARVKLWFISFEFGFGTDRLGAPPVNWDQFKVQLPAPSNSRPSSGIALPDATTGKSEARAATRAPTLMSIGGFSIDVRSALPISKLTVNGELFAGSDNDLVDIRPMRLTGVIHELRVKLLLHGSPFEWSKNDWQLTQVRSGVARALWGAPLTNPAEALKQDGLIRALTGLAIVAPPPERGPSVGPVSSAALATSPVLPDGRMPLRDQTLAGPSPIAVDTSVATIVSTVTSAAVVATRDDVHAALGRLKIPAGPNGSLNAYAALAASAFTDPPMLTAASVR